MENIELVCKKCDTKVELQLSPATLRVFSSAKCSCGGSFQINYLTKEEKK